MKVAGVAAIDVIGMNVSLLESTDQRGTSDTMCLLIGISQSQTLSYEQSSHIRAHQASKETDKWPNVPKPLREQ